MAFCRLNLFLLKKRILSSFYFNSAHGFSTSSVFDKTHYETLKVSGDASQKEIKNAYLKLSKLYHPDVIDSNSNDGKDFLNVSSKYLCL